MELRPPKDIFKGLHYPLTWLNGFCSGRGKRGALIYKKKEGAHDIELLKKSNFQIFFWKEEKVTIREDQEWSNSFFFSSKLPFLDMDSKTQHIHFLVHGHSSWSTFGLHLVRGPKALQIDFLRNQTLEVGPWSQTMEKSSHFMVWLHCPWCKPVMREPCTYC